MKKALVIALTLLMTVAFSSTAFAATVTEGWDGATVDGNKITISQDQLGGVNSKQYGGEALTETPQTYEAIVDLNSDYQYGELFSMSLGFGTDAETYSSEFMVTTLKTDSGFQITANAATDQSIMIADPGIYTYQWTVSNTGGVVSAEFSVVEEASAGKLVFDHPNQTSALNSSECVRYLWAFGRDINGQSVYKLDRDLVLYKAKPVITGVSVVDGTDGYTPVEIPKAEQKLTANVLLADGTIAGSYPVDNHIAYKWYYVESPDVILGTEPVYTVTGDNNGKTLAVEVSGINGYTGKATWTASDVVGAVTEEPTEPGTDDPTTGDGQDGTAAGNTDKGNGQPKTGDSSNVLPFVALLTLAAAAGTAVAVKRRTNQ